MTEVDDVLVALWMAKRPVALERLAIVEVAIAGVAIGIVTADQRVAAIDAAHMLAGALGMYGFPDGTDVCREAEHLLEAPTGGDAASRREAAHVAQRLASLRTDLTVDRPSGH